MKILTYPDPFLRQKAENIVKMDDSLRKFAIQLSKDMIRYDGVGLAAPQVGRSIRMIAINIEKKDLGNLDLPMPLVLVNPQIIEASAEMESANEACLSLPKKYGPVKRPTDIIVNAQDIDMKEMHLEVTGWFARVLQHEIDHLNGILFIDRIEDKDLIKDYEPKEVINQKPKD